MSLVDEDNFVDLWLTGAESLCIPAGTSLFVTNPLRPDCTPFILFIMRQSFPAKGLTTLKGGPHPGRL